MNRGDQVIAVSNFIRDYVHDHYSVPKNKKITVIHRGVEENEYKTTFAPSESWTNNWKNFSDYPPEAKILTLPGRITRWKGQLEFIKLVHQVRSHGIDAYGLIVGGVENKYSNYYKELMHLVKTLNVENNISFLGTRKDLKEILSISDCAYSLTSKPEAFGRTTVEALSLGTPVIGYGHGGTSEILKTMFPWGLVPPRDLNKAVALTKALLTNTSDIAPIQPNPYTVSEMQNKTIALYEKVKKCH
jgi:glycosyltransferase involved in cell wall biosynthesis